MTRFKKLILIIISALAALMMLGVTASASDVDVWDGSISANAPSQTSDGYYIIKTPEELAWAAKQVNSGFTELRIRLNNDIYLNDVAEDVYVNKWTPIGNYSQNTSRVYSGFFDGQGHTIYGLYIDTTAEYQGLFGYTLSANIKNLDLEGVKIKASSNIGGISGYMKGVTTVQNCTVSGEIEATSHNVGGISGYLYDRCTAKACGFSGKISSPSGNRIGGITGCTYSNTVINDCYNTGDITGGKFTGGIVGTNSGSDLKGCYNTGKITATNRAGGIVGNNVGEIHYCYSAGLITCDGDMGGISGYNTMSKVENCYYMSGTCTSGDEFAIEKSEVDIKRYSFVTTMNKGECDYLYDYTAMNNGFPILAWQLQYDIWNGSVEKPDLYIDGKTYAITTGEELAWFAGLVNGTLEGVEQDVNADAMLMNSIILNIGEKVEGVSNIWIPIGVNTAYQGNFTGNGYNISGLYVLDQQSAGLFGNIGKNATVENIDISEAYVDGNCAGSVAGSNEGNVSLIKVSNSVINGDTYVGGVCGENKGNILNSSSVNCDILATRFCGGITGNNTGDINTCYSLSDITASGYIGGITGNNSGNIESCFNGGKITGTENYIGGIAGYTTNGSIRDCYNTGDLTGKSYVGGITGIVSSGSVKNCYDVGEITGTSNTGAVFGAVSDSTVQNCYYDSERINATDSNATALNTAQMTGPAAIANFVGFERAKWDTLTDSQYYVYYPQLSTFSLSGDFDLTDASLESVTFLKYNLNCKVSINEVVTYYDTLSAAAKYIGTGTADIVVFKDVVVDQTVFVNGNIRIIAEGDNHTISRAEGFSGNMFRVNKTLTIGTKTDDYEVTIDGGEGDRLTYVSIVYVNSNGVFTLNKGNLLNNNCFRGGAISNYGTTNLNGGTIGNCSTMENGGAVYNNYILNISGCEIYNNRAFGDGGAVYNYASNAVTTVNSGTVRNNSAANGGAIYCFDGEVNINGSTIHSNTAETGGAVYINGGAVAMTGGTVRNNNADLGNGIYNNSILNLSGFCYIDSSNVIYLPTGKTVTMVGKIESDTVCLTITPEKHEKGIRIVNGPHAAMNYKRVAVTDKESQNWHINSSGYLLTDEVIEVALVSVFGAYSVYYTSLEEAFAEIGTNDAIIKMIDDDTIDNTIVIKSNVTILSDGSERSILRGENLTGNVFVVEPGCTLTLGDNINDAESDILFFDSENITSDSYFKVEKGATLKTYRGVVIENCVSETSGAIDLYGTMEMTGGKIVDNDCAYGGVNVIDGARLEIFEGEISSNKNYGVYCDGDLVMNSNTSIDSSNSVLLCDGRFITLSGENTVAEKIAVIEFEKYALGTLCVSTELDKNVYCEKFDVKDDSYYLDNNMCLAADKLTLKESSMLLLDRETDYLSGIELDVNNAGNIASQFVNDNVAVFNLGGEKLEFTDIVGTGFVVALVDSNGDIYDSVRVVIYGDVDSNGMVDGEDAVLISFTYFGHIVEENVSDFYLVAADTNHDGSIDLSDAWLAEDAGLFISKVSQK